MDQRDSYCPYLPLGELTVRGTGLTKNMGKEDPFELNSSQTLRSDAKGIVISGSHWRTWNTTTIVVVLLNFYVEQVFPLVSRCNHYDTFLRAVASQLRWVYRYWLALVTGLGVTWGPKKSTRAAQSLWHDAGTSVSLRSIKMTLFGREFGWGGTFNKR